jgi:hypothetical protein
MKVEDFWQLFKDLALILEVAALLVFVPCCMSIAVDVHMARLDQARMVTDIQAGIFSRLDKALWKADTFLIDWSKFEQVMSAQMTQVRIQVKQSSDDATHETKLSAKAATTAMTAVATSTAQVLAAVTDQPAPVIQVTQPKPAPVAPPTVILAPVDVPITPAKIAPVLKDKKKAGNWLQRLWSHLHL